MKKLILLASILLFSLASITSMHNSRDLKLNEAMAGGTCCYEKLSICVPDGCSGGDCSEGNRWWRSDGKKCSDSTGDPILF